MTSPQTPRSSAAATPLKRLYMCPHTATYASSYCCICVLCRAPPPDSSLKWRCYASQTPTSDQSDPSPRVEAYCTHNLEIEEVLVD